MPEENSNNSQKPIEKPWAVYGWFLGPWGIGKLTDIDRFRKETDTLHIIYHEKRKEGPTPEVNVWNPEWVHTFNNPVKAMAYFKVHVHNSDYTQEKIIEMFLRNFPNEQSNLEKLLPNRFASSSPKCTEQDTSFGGATYETYSKDKLPHPNRKT